MHGYICEPWECSNIPIGTALNHHVYLYYRQDELGSAAAVMAFARNIISMYCTHIRCTDAIICGKFHFIYNMCDDVLNYSRDPPVNSHTSAFDEYRFRGIITALSRHVDLTRFISRSMSCKK